MSLPEFAVKKKVLAYFVSFILIVAGVGSYFFLGKLEDPDFTVKTALVITEYPGANTKEVVEEVTEPLELALQSLKELKWLESQSVPGRSRIDVEIQGKFTSAEMPQIFDKVRNKVYDTIPKLPPGVKTPAVIDDFGDVFGFIFAITGDGFSYKELRDYVDEIKRELSLVENVSRVEMWGEQRETIYIDIVQSKVAELGLSYATVIDTISQQNTVVPAGGVEIGKSRFRYEAEGTFQSVDEIGNLVIRQSPIDILSAGGDRLQGKDELILLKDIANITAGYQEPPTRLLRYGGKPAIALSISIVPGGNVPNLGVALNGKMEELKASLPLGIEFHKISWQSDLVNESINGFFVSLVQAVLIVVVILWLFMGMRNAIIVGSALVMTILGTFVVMGAFSIDLQRMSLGALVIALGMMVDNAIVVADGAAVNLSKGMDKVKAAVDPAKKLGAPLLGATLIAVGFFLPIYLSPESTGEYCASLFQVVAISLLFSWVISMTTTPLQCIALLKAESNEGKEDQGGFAKKFFDGFRWILKVAIRFRYITLGGTVALLFLSFYLFAYVPQMFFPDASRRQFMLDYWAPEGTRIQEVAEDIKSLEKLLMEDPRVTGVGSFIGEGAPRFYLPVSPERANSAYAQLIVNTTSLQAVHEMVDEIDKWRDQYPDAQLRGRKYAVGPSKPYKFVARITGPGDAKLEDLRNLGEEGVNILKSTPLAKDMRVNWRERVSKVVVNYDQAKGRWTSVTRSDLARTLQRSYDGFQVGLYRERDKLIPILARAADEDRHDFDNLGNLQVTPLVGTQAVPLSQVSTFEVDWEDTQLWRRDRRRAIYVEADPNGVTNDELRRVVVPQFDAIEMPNGYRLDWGGEYEDTRDSSQALLPGLLPVVLLVAVILVGLFNALRPPLIIVSVIPFAVIGIVGGLLVTNQPFGFMALLGAMSLAGMMIKNSIVLLDEAGAQLEEGHTHYRAIVNAAVSRLRPVALAAATTILGVVPLLQDVFWVAMAVVIMGGLAVGTVLTMVVLPVIYSIFYGVKVEDD